MTDTLQLACHIAPMNPVAVSKSSLTNFRDHSVSEELEYIAILNSLALISKDVGLSPDKKILQLKFKCLVPNL
jgi:hypothetical protein